MNATALTNERPDPPLTYRHRLSDMPTLDHIGIAVDEVNAVIDCFDALLDVRPYATDTVPGQQVRTHFLDAETATLELLESLDPDSAIHRFLDRHGEGLHHVAFAVADASAAMDELRDAGFTLLSDSPQSGADDKRIFFVHPKETHGVLVEFCEEAAPSWSPRRVPHRRGHLALYERGDPAQETLLVLHGAGGCTRFETAPLIHRLEPTFHVIGLDLSGHGRSSLPPDDDLTMERFVSDARATLDAVDESSAHVFGFSLGSTVALRLAHQHPDRVDRLALLAPNAEWDRSLANKLSARLDLASLHERAPDLGDRLSKAHEHPKRLFRALKRFAQTLPSTNETMRETLSAVAHPTLVAGLDRDPLFSLDRTVTVHQALSNARLSILPASEHSVAALPHSLLSSLAQTHFTAEETSA